MATALWVGLLTWSCGASSDGTSVSTSEEFCAVAKSFEIGLDRSMSGERRRELLTQLRTLAPIELADSINVLVNAFDGEVRGEKRAGERVGRFIENRCRVNLPGLSTPD